MKPSPPAPATRAAGERAAVSHRGRRWGSALALIVLAALAALAWYLTHRPAATAPGTSGPPGTAGARGAGPSRGGASGARSAPPSTVGIATARHADIPVFIDALGTVTPIAVATVSPQVSGVITEVLYKEGETVKKGQPLAAIDPRPFQMALDQAAAARVRDEAQLNAARVQLERYQVLLKQDSIARQTVDTQDALVKQLAGTVGVDRANENTARLNLTWSRIVAPISGRVGLRPIDVGNYISAGNATGVATITQVSPIDVQFSIPQERVPDVKERLAAGAKLPVSAWDSGRTHKLDDGEFLTLDNQIDVQTGTIKAKARFANAGGALFPNQFVNARLLLRTIDAAVVVPVIALRHGPSGDFVYAVNADHTVSLRNVTAGVSGVDDVEITKGLAVGDVVVTEGGDRLKDGARIQTNADRPAAATGAPPTGTDAGRRGRGSPAKDATGK
ncbi:MAG TPA: efflux RND transporter periplasmic adaptor subunit [Casimicrobiaceae bacterium]|nr:efflux RND transporter periplasmic adaptor subunit [Casimicrobiaceae bacterium]